MDVRLEQDRAVLSLHGELDLASAELFHSEFENAEIGGARMVVLDLEGLQFVDSTGLRMILSAHERARERGQDFAITPGAPQVRRLLTITRVGEHLRVIDSPNELLV
jgi:anti-anti-sigma factor